jgi:hypothetical protein
LPRAGNEIDLNSRQAAGCGDDSVSRMDKARTVSRYPRRASCP